MSQPTRQGQAPHTKAPWLCVLCSLAPLLVYGWFAPVWQHHHSTGWTTDSAGVTLGAVVALNGIWWFLRSARQHVIVKALALTLMIAAVLLAVANGYSSIAYRPYGR